MVSATIDDEITIDLNVDTRKGLWCIEKNWTDEESDEDKTTTIKEFDNYKDADSFFNQHIKSLENDHDVNIWMDMFWNKENIEDKEE